MSNLAQQIAQAEADELNDLLIAIVKRYSEVFPDYQLHTISLEKANSKNEQIDRVIDFLLHMKDAP